MSDGRTVYHCNCGDLSHIMAIWPDPDENQWGDVEVSMIVPWMPIRWRLKQVWALLSGRPATRAFVSLSPDDAVALAHNLIAAARRAALEVTHERR